MENCIFHGEWRYRNYVKKYKLYTVQFTYIKCIFGAENDREQRADRPTQPSGIVFFIIASDRERIEIFFQVQSDQQEPLSRNCLGWNRQLNGKRKEKS